MSVRYICKEFQSPIRDVFYLTCGDNRFKREKHKAAIEAFAFSYSLVIRAFPSQNNTSTLTFCPAVRTVHSTQAQQFLLQIRQACFRSTSNSFESWGYVQPSSRSRRIFRTRSGVKIAAKLSSPRWNRRPFLGKFSMFSALITTGLPFFACFLSSSKSSKQSER